MSKSFLVPLLLIAIFCQISFANIFSAFVDGIFGHGKKTDSKHVVVRQGHSGGGGTTTTGGENAARFINGAPKSTSKHVKITHHEDHPQSEQVIVRHRSSINPSGKKVIIESGKSAPALVTRYIEKTPSVHVTRGNPERIIEEVQNSGQTPVTYTIDSTGNIISGLSNSALLAALG